MIANKSNVRLLSLLLLSVVSANINAALTDISPIPLNTYTPTSSADVKPNVLFIMDDSGSMGWDYLPDWANDNSPPNYYYKNSSFNGVAYNPAIKYTPPVYINADGSTNTTLYPSMTGVSAATGGDGSATAASPNWKAVKNDGYGVQSTGTTNLEGNAYANISIAGEYCTNASLRTCTPATAPVTISSVLYNFPAKLRWCNSTALTTCKATNDGTYNKVRMAIPNYSTITISGSSASGSTISSVLVNGQQILSATTTGSTTASTVASNIATQINLCSNSIPSGSNCTTVGYTATASGSVVTIYAPSDITYTPSVTQSAGTFTLTTTAFQAGTVPGKNLRHTIVSSITSYPYPGSATKAPGRTDCAGTTCTYNEEMINYANWWAYYHTRMQMMKTATSQAFSILDNSQDLSNNISRFRVGYMTINNNNSNDFLNLQEFKTTQKNNWYVKLFNARPNNSTPLREALADAGRIFAGKLNSSTFNGVAVSDPLQYSCQQNFTILSTDGFWNGNAGYKLDGSTAIGNQDADLPRPMADGASVTTQSRTSALQSRTVTTQLQEQTSQLQRQLSQLQKRTSQLETRTSTDSGATWTAWASTGTSSCTFDTSGATRRDCRYAAWTAWSNASACTAVAKDTSGTWGSSGTSYLATECQTVVSTPYTTVSSCTPNATPDASGVTTQCQYTAWTSWANVASCTPVARDTTSPYDMTASAGWARQCQPVTTYGTWTNASSCTASASQQCQYTSWTSWSNVGSCTAVAQSVSPNYTVATARECQSLSSGGTSNTLADVAAYYYRTDLRDSTATGANATGTCDGPIVSGTATDLCANNVPSFGRDVASTQHMTTFTLGLGAQGAMVFSPTYWSDSSGDFYDVYKWSTANTTNGICSWQSSGLCEWPTPASDSINNIDDLWHAAINGRGSYYSASDPLSLSKGLSSTLSTISNVPKPGTAAAAASSNPNISTSDNYVFSSSYRSVEWYGELIRQQLDPYSATLSGIQWSALTQLDCATTPWKASYSYTAGSVYAASGYCYKVVVNYTSQSTFGTTDTDNSVRIVAVGGTPVTPMASRTIYTKGSTGLVSFEWANLDTTQKSYFTLPWIQFVSAPSYSASPVGLSQFCTTGACLSTTLQNNTTVASGGAAGEALVNFLRGDRTHEGTYYRSRTHVLGDIVSSEGRYVKQPLFNYNDSGYSAFVANMASRAGKVYVAANDGMLHSFDAITGRESWAYIPGLILPRLYFLADLQYSQPYYHQYFVDGTPEVGDVCPTAPSTSCSASQWKTILVGGLNYGGKGYYAMDITDPDAPTLLWELSNATTGFENLGYSYSNPRITKLKDGRWVVIFASGYNNLDGQGHVYIVNAMTGALIRDISNNTGTAASPSGLARISAHAPHPSTDNTTQAIYGGDLLGNLWRFDINGDIGATGYEAHKIASLLDASGNPQPITAKPTLTTITANVSGVATDFPVIFVGTGRFLGVSDMSNTQGMSFYGIKDKMDATTYGNIRTSTISGGSSLFVRQTLTATTCPVNTSADICLPDQQVRTVTNYPVDWAQNGGWYFDFVTPGERSSTDSTIGLGTIAFTTISPQGVSADACSSSAGSSSSYSCAVSYHNGGPVLGSNGVACASLGAGIATRPVMLELPDGTIISLIRKSGGGGGDEGPDPNCPECGSETPGGDSTGGEDGGNTEIKKPPVNPPYAGLTQRVTRRKLQ